MTSSPPKRVDLDYAKTYSWYSDPAPLRDLLPYVSTLSEIPQTPGIPHEQLEWCRINCVNPWAWWFDADRAYVGFADAQERFLFAMTYQ